MLSTYGAIFDGHEGESRTFDETDWSDLGKPRLIYHKSKTLAERAAWDFIHSPENKSKMEMVVVNPTNVFGPVLDSHHHTATEWYRTIMHAEVPGVSRTQLDFVDVRDIVDILEKAMTVPEAADKRFLCNGASIPLLEFADILHQNFTNRGYRIINRILPDLIIRFFAIFIPKVRSVAGGLGWEYALSTEQARSVFGWQPRPYKQTILDMAESLIEYGLV
jgi:dihydroflavonol-4-reductase